MISKLLTVRQIFLSHHKSKYYFSRLRFAASPLPSEAKARALEINKISLIIAQFKEKQKSFGLCVYMKEKRSPC